MKDIDDYFMGFIAIIIFVSVVYTIISIEINANTAGRRRNDNQTRN